MDTPWRLLFFLAVLIPLSSAEIVKFDNCNNHVDVNCNITEVRVSPCSEAAMNKPCNIKRGKDALIEFDFQPGGNYTDLETRAYWASSTGDLPWIGMNTDGCAHTECPTKPSPETFKYNLHIGSKLPARNYDVKWRLWKEDAMECCFLIRIKLVK